MFTLNMFGQTESFPLIQKSNTAFIVYSDSDKQLVDNSRLLVSYTKSHPYTGNSVDILLYDNCSFDMCFSTDIPNFDVYTGKYQISKDTLILKITFSLSDSTTCRKRYFKIDENQITSLAIEQETLTDCVTETQRLQLTNEIFYIKE